MKIAIAQTCPVSGPRLIPSSLGDMDDVNVDVFEPITKNLTKVWDVLSILRDDNEKQNMTTVEGTTPEQKEQHAEEQCDLRERVQAVVLPEYFLQGIVEEREYMTVAHIQILETLQHFARSSGISITGTLVELHDPEPCSLRMPTVSPWVRLVETTNTKYGEEEPEESEECRRTKRKWYDWVRHRFPRSFLDDVNTSSSFSSSSSKSMTRKDVPHRRPTDTNTASTNQQGPRSEHTEERDLPDHGHAVKGSADRGDGAEERHDRMINVAYYIEGGTGDIVGRYVKKNLWIAEREYLAAGEGEHEVFRVHGVKAGHQICWDLAHAEGSRRLAEQGVDIIFAPTYWMGTDSEPAVLAYDPPPDYELNLLRSLAYVRAFESETALVLCNAGGPPSEGFIGGSGVWMPFKGELQGKEIGLPDNGLWDGEKGREWVKTYELNLELLKSSRRTYQIRSDWKVKE